MRLIDADALLAHHDLTEYLLGWLGLRNVKAIIEHLPTIEAVPVVRGEWIDTGEHDGNDNYAFRCSSCGYADLHSKTVDVPFCWHCGADMRESEVTQ